MTGRLAICPDANRAPNQERGSQSPHWLWLVAPGLPVQLAIHHESYDVAAIAVAIRAAGGLPAHCPMEIGTGGVR